MKHNITIQPAINQGFRVQIGPHPFIFYDSESLMLELADYFAEPEKWEKKYTGCFTAPECTCQKEET